MNLLTFTSIECSLLIALGTLFLIEILYYVILYNRIYLKNGASKRGKIAYADQYAPLSVILSAKDAAPWLQAHLPLILEQDYPCYEVIVVNDASTDDTEEVLKQFEQKYPHLYHTFTPASSRYVSHKKLSLTLGIRAAKYDWLVFTEVNGCPVSKDWLKSMARNFVPGTNIVLGYSNYQPEKRWFNRKIRFDQLLLSMRYLGCAALHLPYMGQGANIAYRKEFYYQTKGYSAYLTLQRGEDDLFVNQHATMHNTRVECTPESAIRLVPPMSGKLWNEEKVSYVATSHHYKGLQCHLMAFESICRCLFLLECFALCLHAFYYQHWAVGIIALLLWIIRYAVQRDIFRQTARSLNESPFSASLLLFDLLQPLWSLRHKIQWMFRQKSEFMRK